MFKYIIFIAYLAFLSTVGQAQDFSNKGTDFYITYPTHIDDVNSAMGIYITSDVQATGNIKVGNLNLPFTVSPNTIVTKFLGPSSSGDAPNTSVYLSTFDGIESNKAIHVTSDNPVVVYAHIIRSARSGATLVLPTPVWGKQYLIPSYQNIGSSNNSTEYGYPAISVVAYDTNTIIKITAPATSRDGNRPANTPFTVTIPKPGDVYQIQFQQNSDISGATVETISSGSNGCHKIAVFSSTSWTSMGCSRASSGDNFFQQLTPTAAWGKNYVTAPAYGRSYDIIRVYVLDTATKVFVTENNVTRLLNGLTNNTFYEFSTGNPTYITADKSISVVQFYTTQSCDPGATIGDPEMVVLSPMEQTINNITFFSAHQSKVPPGQSNVNSCYLNVIIKSNATKSFKINNKTSSGIFFPIPGTPYSYLQQDVTSIAIQNPSINIKADSNFSAIAYGFGRVESFGYNTGTNVKDLNQFITVTNPYQGLFNNNVTCNATAFKLGIVLPYATNLLKWDFQNTSLISPNQTITVNNPTPDSSFISDGKTFYWYKLSSIFNAGNTLSTFPIKITINSPTSGGCGGLQTFTYNVRITQKPQANFGIQSDGCIQSAIQLTDSSSAYNNIITKRNWTLQGQINDTDLNPIFVPTTVGNQNFNLRIISDIGCFNDTLKTVLVTSKPLVNIKPSSAICNNSTINLFEDCQVTGGSLIKWIWEVNGKQTAQFNTKGNFIQSTFTTSSTDTFTLIATGSSGCSNRFTTSFIPSASPRVGFITPSICLSDALAQFTDTSSISDNSAAGFTYLWSFGDANATATNPNTSNQKNPTHKYAAVGNYTIQLKVTSNKGCADSLQKSFTVNGSTPKAGLAIANTQPICSNLPISFINKSTVDFGAITKIIVNWNAQPNTKDTEVYIFPKYGDTLKHIYPSFQQPASKSYRITWQAYSGISCVDEIDTTITIYSIPEITHSILPSKIICLGDSLVLTANELSSSAPSIVSWVWQLGDGTQLLSNSGTKTYTDSGKYILDVKGYNINGCYNKPETDTVHIVYVPKALNDSVINVLEGNSVTLSPNYLGYISRYTWRPAIYLNATHTPSVICTPKSDTTYTILVENATCSSNTHIKVYLLYTPLIPNVFSPNGDGIHDTWNISFLSRYKFYFLSVFDRNGQEIFTSSGSNPILWDGTYGGKPVPIGTYYYILKPGNGRETMTGSVTVIR